MRLDTLMNMIYNVNIAFQKEETKEKVPESFDNESYRLFCRSTAVYPDANTGRIEELTYLGLGLNGEAGEVAEKIKKLYRDGFSDEVDFKGALLKELSDVIWYVTRIADTLDCSLTELIGINVKKLSARKENETLHGSGDDR